MKRILLASSILAASTGLAAAEVTLSGEARMGIIDSLNTVDEVAFTSRARVTFTLSGETDGGLSFGASFRADNAGSSNSAALVCTDDGDGVVEIGECVVTNTSSGGANTGRAGEVSISGAFGKLTMGDIDGAAQQAVGNVDSVGLTGLGDLNEADYISAGSGGSDPTAAYEYTAGAFTGIASITSPQAGVESKYAFGMKYVAGDYAFSLGFEKDPNGVDDTYTIVGTTAKFGAVVVKANYGQRNTFFNKSYRYHLSATYAADALAVTAFYSDRSDAPSLGFTAYGLGASYNLGGGAKVVGGYVNRDRNVLVDSDAYDLGVSFSF